MLKKLLTLLMALCMLCGVAVAEGTNVNLYPAASTDANAITCLALQGVGDKLYMLITRNEDSSHALVQWAPGMAEPAEVAPITVTQHEEGQQTHPEYLFANGDDLYGLDNFGGGITLLVRGGAAVMESAGTLDLNGLAATYDGYTDHGTWVSLFAQDGMLYGLNIMWDENGIEQRRFCQFDVSTGERVAMRADEGLISLAPYKDGKLLCLYRPGGEFFDQETGDVLPLLISSYDPATGSVETITAYTSETPYYVTMLMYSAENDTAYYMNAGVVYSLPGMTGEPVISAYIPVSPYGDDSPRLAIMSGGLCAYRDYSCVYVRQLDAPDVKNGALTLYNEYGTGAHAAVVTAHPELNIQFSEVYFSGIEELTAAMVSGESALDLLKLNTSYTPLKQLIAKGYAADLSTMAGVMEVVSRMDSRFTEPFTVDGKLYGLPVSIDSYMLAYSPTVAEALGIDPADLPKTYMELLDFCANFYYDYGEAHPEFNLFMNLNIKEQLLNELMNSYIAYQFRTNGEQSISFDTPLFQKLLAALDAIDFTELDPYALLGDDVWNDMEAINEFYGRESLFTTYSVSPAGQREDSYALPLLLALDEGLDPVIPVALEVYILNPRSTRADQAALYLGEYVKHYNPENENVMFFPDNNAEVLNPYYESNMQFYTNTIADLEKRLEAASDENKADLQAELDMFIEWRTEYEQQRVSLTVDDIARYRETLAPYLYVMPQTPLTDYSGEGSSEIQTQLSQYIDGAIDAATFIREINARVRMMMLEGQ